MSSEVAKNAKAKKAIKKTGKKRMLRKLIRRKLIKVVEGFGAARGLSEKQSYEIWRIARCVPTEKQQSLFMKLLGEKLKPDDWNLHIALDYALHTLLGGNKQKGRRGTSRSPS
jgi:hypothetical protein